MGEIERIYYNMDKLSDNYSDTPEAKEARDRLEEAIGEDAFLNLEDRICGYGAAQEKQGFIMGFRYAVNLLVGVKIPQ